MSVNGVFVSNSTFPSTPRWTYDVFLSFRGDDTRKNFTDHLYTALMDSEIFTFRDDEELPRGKDISMELVTAIKDSKIAVIVFSKGYASSSWCLDELVEIVECMKNIGQLVLPVFYNVDPDDVSTQSGCFEAAFCDHEKRFSVDKVETWRQALKTVSDLSGWDLQSMANGYESIFIGMIVQEVSGKLNKKYLNVATYPVGIHARVNNIIKLLNVGSTGVRMAGIYGMGGIGKTTLAKAVFNRLHVEFEWSCFLLNVKDMAAQPNGLVQLQEQLLRDITKSKIVKVNNVDRGTILIREKLHRKKVLIVFDDVDNFQQLNALACDRNFFCKGSRIIITTRDEHMLTQLGDDEKYEVAELDCDSSLELFTWHAFKENRPTEDYVEVLADVVEYVGGVPLALEVLGSYLSKRKIPEWRDAIKNLKKIPYHEIQKKLKLSFDTLDDDYVKDIFLDIACFFIGMDKDIVQQILDGFGFSIGFSILHERSLVKVDDANKLRMHDLLRDMGREIVREEAPKHPGERSRIWVYEDVVRTLNNQTGTRSVEGLTLDVRASSDLDLSTQSFMKMYFLRLLKINGAHLSGGYQHLSKELKWLCWHECPLKSIPPEFQLDNVVVLDMQFSNIRELWKGVKPLKSLKILNLSHSVHLTRTPNFSGASRLERLILEGCTGLVEIHQSIGCLEQLVFLNLESCKILKNLPDNICSLQSLETLNISNCIKLEKLPEQFGRLEALNELLADGTAIKQLPSSFGQLKNLKTLSLVGLKSDSPSTSWFTSLFSAWFPPKSSDAKALIPASFTGLSSLTKLVLRDCGLSDGAFPINLGSLSSLNYLDLGGNEFFNLPTGIGRLNNLEMLYLNSCSNLKSALDLPSGLLKLETMNCTSMERLSFQSKEIVSIRAASCHKLVEIQGLEHLETQLSFGLTDCYNLNENVKKILLQMILKGQLPYFCYPGSEIPQCFHYQGEGSSMSFHVPPMSKGQIRLIFCCVYALTDEESLPDARPITIRNKSTGRECICRPMVMVSDAIGEDHIGISYTSYSSLPSPMKARGELVLSISTHPDVTIKKCGMHLIANAADTSDHNQGALMPYAGPSYENMDDSSVVEELNNAVATKRVYRCCFVVLSLFSFFLILYCSNTD